MSSGYTLKITEKIKLIRLSEGLSQNDFVMLTGINIGTLRNYEQGNRESVASSELEKITKNEQLKKYTLWLMTDETAPEIGQISPPIEEERRA